MRDDLHYARELEHTILAAIAEDRCEQLDLPGLIDDLAMTYEDIIVRLRRMQQRHAAAGRRAESGCLILARAEFEQALIEEGIPQ